MLVSRTESKPQILFTEITQKYTGSAIQIKILLKDFSKNNKDDYAKLKALVNSLNVGIRINNIGQSYSILVPFIFTPKNKIRDIITINYITTLRVTQIIALRIVQRKRGLILTIGSFGSLLPTPLFATYSRSKAFL